MKLLDLLNDGIYKDKFKCIACGEMIDADDMYDEVITGNIGICLDCLGSLPWVSTGIKFFSKFDNRAEIYAPLFYRDAVRDIIMKFKFNGEYNYSTVLADIIHYRLDEPHIDIPSKYDMIVPVPLSKERLRDRGYNQSALIAKKLARLFDMEYCEDAIVRIRNTKVQSLQESADDRFANVHGAFRAVPDKVFGKRVIIVDDIYTHGYTMNECISAVQFAGAAKTGAIAVALAVSGKYMLI